MRKDLARWKYLCLNTTNSCRYTFWMQFNTRMHSSMMRTVRCSGRRGGCLPRRGACPGRVWPEGVCSGGCGVCLGVYPSMHWGRHPPPPEDRILDTCLLKPYLSATTLRTVTRLENDILTWFIFGPWIWQPVIRSAGLIPHTTVVAFHLRFTWHANRKLILFHRGDISALF